MATLTYDREKTVAPTFCVFRHRTSWLAFPAHSVREVLVRPEMVVVPGTPESFIGLCHLRSEFIPVLNLSCALSGSSESDGSIMLVLDDADGPWAVLVDQVRSLQALEMSDAPEGDPAQAETPVIGWATFNDEVIQVLDSSRIRHGAEHALAVMWNS